MVLPDGVVKEANEYDKYCGTKYDGLILQIPMTQGVKQPVAKAPASFLLLLVHLQIIRYDCRPNLDFS